MDFAVWPSYERDWDETVALARWARASGFRSYWYADHLMPNTDDGAPDGGSAFECWTVLTAVGAVVPDLRLMSMVSPVTIHHPVLLAKRATTLDHISGGRVTLGLGAGWQVNEHGAYGFELPAPGLRVSRFAEAIEVIHRLLREPSVDFDGEWLHLRDAPLEPKGVQQPLPILVGTGSPRMLRLTARFADEWNTWGDPALVAERTESFLRACDTEGRDPATVRRSVQAMVFLVHDEDAAERMRPHVPAGRSLVGTTSQLVDQLAEYVAQGVDEFAVPDFTLGNSPAERADTYARLHADVLSAFR
jgi:alkanesulfonate monooxygenase SsuD/methylene tetrahydromethanopterin reductase-like flavin-dependent oxidoreductase (luciferase family)